MATTLSEASVRFPCLGCAVDRCAGFSVHDHCVSALAFRGADLFARCPLEGIAPWVVEVHFCGLHRRGVVMPVALAP